MSTFKLGDFVKLINVSEEDKIHGRYVGEIGIYQGIYNYEEENDEEYKEIDEELSYVRFDNSCGTWGGYVVYTKDIKFEKVATLESIFKAECLDSILDNHDEFINRIKEFYDVK